MADGVGRSFLVEMSRDGHRSRHHSRVAIGALIALTIPSVIGGYFLAPWILGIFGHPYAVHATSLLRMQLLALPASAVMVIYTAYAWYDQRVWRLVFRQLAMLVIFLRYAAPLVGRVGILAVGWATIVSSHSWLSSSYRQRFGVTARLNRTSRSRRARREWSPRSSRDSVTSPESADIPVAITVPSGRRCASDVQRIVVHLRATVDPLGSLTVHGVRCADGSLARSPQSPDGALRRWAESRRGPRGASPRLPARGTRSRHSFNVVMSCSPLRAKATSPGRSRTTMRSGGRISRNTKAAVSRWRQVASLVTRPRRN